MWYHDHALGITRLNVIMGLAGFYILRDDLENNLGLPSGPYEVPLVLQDRDFDANGEFVYPDQLQQTYHGQSIVVNGKVWPYLDVDQGKYRFRVLNGSTTRTYTVRFENTTDRTLLPITVIGTEGGLYQNARPAPNNEVTLAPAERFELIVDFAGLARRTEVIMKNSAVTDFPTGSSPMGGTQNLVKFIVGRRTGFTGPVPDPLRPFSAIDPATISVPPRPFNLVRVPEACAGGEWLVQSLDAPPPGGAVIGEHWDDITEYPILGNTEIWEFYNMSSLMHPMHIHLVLFQVINRQAVDTQGNLVGPIIPPDPLEVNSWKETVQAKPGMVTRVIMTFEDYTGKFPYHCHIIEHEDHEMMRQFQTTYDPDLAVIDGVCSPMEDCISNPTDCPTASGALCGNKLCEIEDGEDCLNCPEDCAGQQIGAPDDFCCGSGAGTNPVTNCGFDADGFTVLDNRCLSNEFYCRVKARVPACCGDSLCEGQETSVSCPTDCAPTGACTYVDPTVVITPPAQDVNAGNSVTYTVSVTNNDTGACPMTTFNLTVDDSDNGADFVTPSTVNPTSVMLMPGASQDVILTVTAQPDGTGSNDTAVTATDTALPPNHADVTSNMVTTTIVAVQPAVGVRNGELVSGRYEGPKKNQVFVPAATFTVGEDVFIHAIVRDQTENPVENADVELTITGPAGYANVLVASQSDPNGLVETKWRTRRLDPGAYTITVTNVTNGVMWDGVMTNINVTLQ
jgi:spore coat protein A